MQIYVGRPAVFCERCFFVLQRDYPYATGKALGLSVERPLNLMTSVLDLCPHTSSQWHISLLN